MSSFTLVPAELQQVRRERALLEVMSVVVLAAWLPNKLLPYIVPFLSTMWYALRTRDLRPVLTLHLWFMGWLLLIGTWTLADTDYQWFGGALASITYSSFLLFLALPTEPPWSSALFDKTAWLVAWVAFFQGVLGIAQAWYGFFQSGSFDLANGDWVKGTIGFSLAGFTQGGDFSNAMYAANIMSYLIFIFPWVLRGRYRLHFLAGLVAVLLASVIHVLLFGFLAVVLAHMIVRPRLKATYLVALVLLWLFAAFMMPTNLRLLPHYLEQFRTGEVPRSVMISRVLHEVPTNHPEMPFIGLGPGQFTSRAGLIATGMYIGGPLNPRDIPAVPGPTVVQEAYLMDLWLSAARVSYYGSTHQPYFSWLSIYSEFGLPALIVIVLGIYVVIKGFVRASRCGADRTLAATGVALALLLVSLGFQENYLEIPQAILPTLLLLRALQAGIWTSA